MGNNYRIARENGKEVVYDDSGIFPTKVGELEESKGFFPGSGGTKRYSDWMGLDEIVVEAPTSFTGERRATVKGEHGTFSKDFGGTFFHSDSSDDGGGSDSSEDNSFEELEPYKGKLLCYLRKSGSDNEKFIRYIQNHNDASEKQKMIRFMENYEYNPNRVRGGGTPFREMFDSDSSDEDDDEDNTTAAEWKYRSDCNCGKCSSSRSSVRNESGSGLGALVVGGVIALGLLALIGAASSGSKR